MRTCFFSRFDDRPCDGPMDRCHLIPKQRIRRELKGEIKAKDMHLVVWHRSVWVWGCRRHHADFDNKVFRVPRSAVPANTEAFAVAFRLEWSLDRDFPVP